MKKALIQKEPNTKIVKHEPKSMTPMDMISMAVEQKADLTVIEKLMDLQDRWEKTEARKAFVHSMNAFKSNLPDIYKKKKADFGSGKAKYDYASLDNITDVITENLSKHQLSFRWDTKTDNGKIVVTCILTHDMGHSEQTTLEAPSDTTGNKNAIQAIGSTITYLQRYTLLSMTGMAAKNMDTDGNIPEELITDEQCRTLITMVQSLKTPNAAKNLLTILKVGDFKSLPAKQYDSAVTMINLKNKVDSK